MLRDHYQTNASEWKYSWEGTPPELIASPRELAAKAAQDVFDRFGLAVPLETLLRLQKRMGR